MTISRREFFATSTVVTSLAASSLSACSPLDIPNVDLPGRFFAAVTLGRLVQAKDWLGADSSLAIVSTAGSQRFEGPDDVTEALYRLLKVEGFSMVGDGIETTMGGMYWRQLGPWHCSDMIKGSAVELGVCGDGLWHGIFNVMVDVDFSAERIKTILLLENRNLIVQLAEWQEPIEFGE